MTDWDKGAPYFVYGNSGSLVGRRGRGRRSVNSVFPPHRQPSLAPPPVSNPTSFQQGAERLFKRVLLLDLIRASRKGVWGCSPQSTKCLWYSWYVGRSTLTANPTNKREGVVSSVSKKGSSTQGLRENGSRVDEPS